MTDEKLIADEFARCAPWLMSALEYNGGECSLADVYDGLMSGSYILMGGEKSAAILEPVEHVSGKRVLNFFLAGGDLTEIREMEARSVEWARQEGFDSVAIFGRRGWLKQLDGYTEKAVYMEKRI
jgi:hypothetical protein